MMSDKTLSMVGQMRASLRHERAPLCGLRASLDSQISTTESTTMNGVSATTTPTAGTGSDSVVSPAISEGALSYVLGGRSASASTFSEQNSKGNPQSLSTSAPRRPRRDGCGTPYTTSLSTTPPAACMNALAGNGSRGARYGTRAAAVEELSLTSVTANSNLFIRNLDIEVEQAELEAAFSKCGKILSSAVMRNIHTGESLGTAFVRMGSHAEAQQAMDVLNGIKMGSRPISVQWAKRHDGAPVGEARRKIMKLFIRNIPLDCTTDSLVELFTPYGMVRQVTLHKDTAPVEDPAMERRIAFVIFGVEGAAERASNAVHNTKPFASCASIPFMIKLAEDQARHERHRGSYGGDQRHGNGLYTRQVTPAPDRAVEAVTPSHAVLSDRSGSGSFNNGSAAPAAAAPAAKVSGGRHPLLQRLTGAAPPLDANFLLSPLADGPLVTNFQTYPATTTTLVPTTASPMLLLPMPTCTGRTSPSSHVAALCGGCCNGGVLSPSAMSMPVFSQDFLLSSPTTTPALSILHDAYGTPVTFTNGRFASSSTMRQEPAHQPSEDHFDHVLGNQAPLGSTVVYRSTLTSPFSVNGAGAYGQSPMASAGWAPEGHRGTKLPALRSSLRIPSPRSAMPRSSAAPVTVKPSPATTPSASGNTPKSPSKYRHNPYSMSFSVRAC